MSSSNTGSLEQMSKKITHDKCGTDDCCMQCDTAIVGDTPPDSALKALEKAYTRPRFNEYGNYGENNPPVGGYNVSKD